MTSAPQPAEATPSLVCYRHPDRETYIRCTRCDRPICGECMRPAPVGFQCPEEVTAARRSARAPVGRLGGPAAAVRPVVTYTVLGLCLLGYVLEGLPGLSAVVTGPGARFANRFSEDPASVAGGEYYRLLTYSFLHVSLLHILFNMYALYLMGPPLEQLLGRARFVALYAVSALGSGVLVYWLDESVVGASGAVYGLFAAYFLVARKLGLNAGGILAVIAINLVLSVVLPGISLAGHVGGLVTGAVLGLAFTALPARARAGQWAAVAAVVAVLVALTMVKKAALR